MSRSRKIMALDNSNDIDLTPMLDVVFIMLIFFIVTASFVKEQGIDPNIPLGLPSDDQNQSSILIRISADNQVWIFEKEGERRVDSRSVRSVVERARAENPKSSVIIQASEKADTQTYVMVADAIRQTGALPVLISKVD